MSRACVYCVSFFPGEFISVRSDKLDRTLLFCAYTHIYIRKVVACLRGDKGYGCWHNAQLAGFLHWTWVFFSLKSTNGLLNRRCIIELCVYGILTIRINEESNEFFTFMSSY